MNISIKFKQILALDKGLFSVTKNIYKTQEEEPGHQFKSVKRIKRVFWIYAASIGELKSALYISRLIAELPYFKNNNIKPLFFVSFDTASAYRIYKKIPLAVLPGYVFFFHPISCPGFAVRSYAKKIKPDFFISVEHAVHKNLIIALSKLNARICYLGLDFGSDYAKKKEKKIDHLKSVDKKLLKNICISVTDEAGKEKLVKEYGNALYSITVLQDPLKLNITDIYQPYSSHVSQVSSDAPAVKNTEGGVEGYKDKTYRVIAFVSVHKKETDFFLRLMPSIKKEVENGIDSAKKLKLIFIPRNIKNVAKIKRKALKAKFKPVYFKKDGIPVKDFTNMDGADVLIIDEYGVLNDIYKYADIVYVGKSLFAEERGGHNVIEPAVYAKPVITGPFADNFKDIIEIFLKNDAITVFNQEEFTRLFAGFIKNEKLWKNRGLNAYNTYMERKKKAKDNLSDFFNKELFG